jgi:uroporphyrinogen decarboxylase
MSLIRHKPDPDFGRLVTALKRGTPDRVPLIELIVGGRVMSDVIGEPVDTHERYVRFHYVAGYDYVRATPWIDFNPAGRLPREGVRRAEAGAADGERTWASESEGVITSWTDFEQHTWPRPEDVDYRMIEECAACLPNGMQLVGHHGDIFTKVWQLMGYETFCFALVEQPDLVEALFERVGSIVLAAFREMAACAEVGALWYSDDIAYAGGLMMSPADLRTHLFPWMRRIGDLCRDRGIPYIYHTDGTLWEVLDDLAACGVDALHPVEPKAMDAAELKRRYGDRFALAGNVDLGHVLALGTSEDVRREVEDRLRTLGPGGGYCCGSSNTVPDYVPTGNYAAMVNAALERGVYPNPGETPMVSGSHAD